MKKIVMLLGFISAAVFSTASAEINISGQIQDAHWTKDLSPYKVQGRAVIPEGSTVTVEPGVKVLFEGQAILEVRGALHVDGTSADPAQFDLMQGGLNSYLLVKGGEFKATNAVFLGGVLALENAKVDVQGCEIAKGSGPYLMGATQAAFRNDKIYGNASGATLDGDDVQAVFEFDTLVQNTYGLHLKKYASLKFVNNSVHDNRQYQAVNDSPMAPSLADNFWGTLEVSQIAVKGKVDLGSPKSMKEVIRAYVKTQLPRIPAGKVAQVARQAKAERAAVKSDARKADALRKKMADAVVQAEKNKKLAEAKKAREEKAKALADKRAEARKAAAEALAQKKADAAAKRKAAAEALAQKKADSAAKRKAAKEAAEAAKAPAEAAPAPASTELELSPAAAEPTAAPTAPAATLEVPAVPLMETPAPAAAETTAPAAPASSLEVPAAPSMETPAPAAAETPAPAAAETPAPAASTSTLEVPGVPSMEAPALNDSTQAPAMAAPAAPAADSTAKPAVAAAATPAQGQTAPSMEIPAPPSSVGASALDTFNPSDIPAPPGAPAASSAPAAAVPPTADVPAPPANPEPVKGVETPAAPAAPAAAVSTPASSAPPAIPSDLAPPAGTDDLGKLDLPPMNDKAVSAPKDMDLPPVDDLGKLDLDLK